MDTYVFQITVGMDGDTNKKHKQYRLKTPVWIWSGSEWFLEEPRRTQQLENEKGQ